MTIGFPSAAGDSSNDGGTFTVHPPSNTVNGDLLIATAIIRNGWTTQPAGLPNLVTWTGANGTFSIYALAVPLASALPSGWAWTASSGRGSMSMIRVTGADMTTPVPQVGTTSSAGSDTGGSAGSNTALPLVLPGVTMAGGALAFVGSFFVGDTNAPSADFVPGFTQRSTLTTPAAGVGRSAQGVYVATGTGVTGDITTANDWPGAPAGQDGILIAIAAASAPVVSHGLMMAGIV